MEPFLGEIKLVGFNFAPKGWALCQGQLLPIAQNEALFSLLGINFGGDGIHNFKLPTLPQNNSCTYIIALQGIYPSRN
jgi:microcystin-dependent protein